MVLLLWRCGTECCLEYQAELVALLNETTVGETYFYRNEPQLEALRKIVLPRIVEAKANLPLRRLRIWSAGTRWNTASKSSTP